MLLFLITICVIVSQISCYYCSIKDFKKLDERLTWCKSEISEKINEIRIKDGNITLLPNLVKQTPNVVRLYIQSNLSSVHTDTGKSICKWEELKEIKIVNNSLRKLPSRFLYNCQQLFNLDLSRNSIVQIEKKAFDNLSKLLTLTLDFNQIKTLHKDTFKPLKELLCLNLIGNQLQTIDADLFYHNPKIYSINLQNNDLRFIKRSFRMLKKLHFLWVSNNNNLESLDLPHVGSSLIANVSNCNLNNLYITQNVLKVFATNNRISFIEIHSNNKLQYLDIRHNQLNKLIYVKNTELLRSLRQLSKNNDERINIHFINLCSNELYYQNLKQSSEQSINFYENKNELIAWKSIIMPSNEMNIENQMQIDYDCTKHDANIYVDKNDIP